MSVAVAVAAVLAAAATSSTVSESLFEEVPPAAEAAAAAAPLLADRTAAQRLEHLRHPAPVAAGVAARPPVGNAAVAVVAAVEAALRTLAVVAVDAAKTSAVETAVAAVKACVKTAAQHAVNGRASRAPHLARMATVDWDSPAAGAAVVVLVAVQTAMTAAAAGPQIANPLQPSPSVPHSAAEEEALAPLVDHCPMTRASSTGPLGQTVRHLESRPRW